MTRRYSKAFREKNSKNGEKFVSAGYNRGKWCVVFRSRKIDSPVEFNWIERDDIMESGFAFTFSTWRKEGTFGWTIEEYSIPHHQRKTFFKFSFFHLSSLITSHNISHQQINVHLNAKTFCVTSRASPSSDAATVSPSAQRHSDSASIR